MRIGIDARFRLSGGIDRYIFELLKYLAKVDRKNIYYIYVSPEEYVQKLKIGNANFNFIPLREERYHPKAPFVLSRKIKEDNIDVFHALSYWMIPLFSKCPLVITVHDTFALSKMTNTLYGRVYGKLFNTLAVKRATKIVAVSEFTRNKLSKYFPEYGDKVIVVYHGVGQEFHIKEEREVNNVLKKYHIKSEFLLYVGSFKGGSKNIANLLRAYFLLTPELRKKYPMVIIGTGKEYVHDTIYNYNLDVGNIFIIDYTEDINTLVAFYNAAKALVMPSVLEYFGLPVVEAMACGTPVVSSNTSSLPEIAGDAAAYFNPLSIEDIKLSIERILTDDNLCKELILKGSENIKRFSWYKAASDMLIIYEQLNQKK